MITRYSPEIESLKRNFFNSCNECQRRHFAAQEAVSLGHGGKIYISKLFGIDLKTIWKGVSEISAMKDSTATFPVLPFNRQRQAGGGRKKRTERTRSI